MKRCYVDLKVLGNIYDDCILEDCAYAGEYKITRAETCPHWRESAPKKLLNPENFCKCCGQKLPEE